MAAAVDTGAGGRYAERVTFVASLRRLARKLMPPGNRGSLDTEYRQPNHGDQANSEPRPPGPGNWAGWGGQG